MIKPFRLAPVFKDYIWGGDRLKKQYGKDTPYDITAESWELSCHEDGACKIVGGTYDGCTLSDVIAAYKEQGMDITGTNCARFDKFPVLNKLIDANSSLSVQVHPTDEYAKKHENGSYGKTEVWYVVDAEPGARLVYGMAKDMTKEEFLQAINTNTLTECLNFVSVKAGDVFFVESGLVHAIGPGILICEIQQNSNTTYRVYDWGRVGADGKPRALHVEKAAAVSRLTKETKTDFSPELISEENGVKIYDVASCTYFTAKKYVAENGVMLRTTPASFSGITILNGEGIIRTEDASLPYYKGETFFFAAQEAEFEICGACEFLETTIEK